jgi:hypothetical protein
MCIDRNGRRHPMTTYPFRPTPFSADPAIPDTPSIEALRMTPLEWARRRREGKENRRLEAAGDRAAHRLERLGADWHLIEWPHTVRPDTVPAAQRRPGAEAAHAGFLAIGPGGVFAISVADHGSKRVLISGRRPPLVAAARRDARRASKAMSAAVGLTIPVIPVLALVGRGDITIYGLPKDCVITSYRELDHVLSSAGHRISPVTAEKLSEVARSPWTWTNEPVKGYTWHPEGMSNQ